MWNNDLESKSLQFSRMPWNKKSHFLRVIPTQMNSKVKVFDKELDYHIKACPMGNPNILYMLPPKSTYHL